MNYPIEVNISVNDKNDKLCARCLFLSEKIDNNTGIFCKLFESDLFLTLSEDRLEGTDYPIRCAKCRERTSA